MTNQELNRDIKRLWNKVESLVTNGTNNDTYFTIVEKEIKPEFIRLYNADREFKALNRQNILILLKLNLRYRIVPLHAFGLFIEI